MTKKRPSEIARAGFQSQSASVC